jgi:hypothetical protein
MWLRCGGDYVEKQWDSSTVTYELFLLDFEKNNLKNMVSNFTFRQTLVRYLMTLYQLPGLSAW